MFGHISEEERGLMVHSAPIHREWDPIDKKYLWPQPSHLLVPWRYPPMIPILQGLASTLLQGTGLIWQFWVYVPSHKLKSSSHIICFCGLYTYSTCVSSTQIVTMPILHKYPKSSLTTTTRALYLHHTANPKQWERVQWEGVSYCQQYWLRIAG